MLVSRIISIALLTLFLRSRVDNSTQAAGIHGENDGLSCCLTENHDQCVQCFNAAITNITSNSIVTVTEGTVLSLKVKLEGLDNITIIGQGNSTVSCNGIGAIKFVSCNNVTIRDIHWEKCGSNNESTYPGIEFHSSSNIVILNCSFHRSIEQAIVLSKVSGNMSINKCNFTDSAESRGHGIAIHHSNGIENDLHLGLIINNCNFSYNGAAKSVVYIDSLTNNPLSVEDSVFSHNQGVPLYISNTALHLKGVVLFEHNIATDGAALFSNNSIIFFKGNSNFSFCNNLANASGGAIFLNHSKICFEGSTFIHFKNNNASSHGGALSFNKSIVSFGEQSVVSFQGNKAGSRGGAIYCENCSALFNENSKVTFSGNKAKFGGAICSYSHSVLLFGDSTVVTFTNNIAEFGGGAVYSRSDSEISFDGTSVVSFRGNSASKNGGAVNSQYDCIINFNGHTVVTFSKNKADTNGGGVASSIFSVIVFYGSTNVIFNGNTAINAGAIWSERYSNMLFDGKSKVRFTDNYASGNGGAFCVHDNSNVTFIESSVVIFIDNRADIGGAVCFDTHCDIIFNGSSNVTFNNNRAKHGGAVYSSYYSIMLFGANTIVTFNGNIANKLGGGLNLDDNCNISFVESSLVTFTDNSANYGGAIRLDGNCFMSFDENSRVTFKDNAVKQNGGAVLIYKNCSVKFDKNTTVRFDKNRANLGGGMYILSFSFTSFDGNSTVTFSYNRAVYGGALMAVQNCDISYYRNTVVMFNNNSATYGGVVYSELNSNVLFDGNSTVSYKGNSASEVGGAITSFKHCSITFDGNSKVTFVDNRAIHAGAILSEQFSNILFNRSTIVTYEDNYASKRGGAVISLNNCSTVFHGNSLVTFNGNEASSGGVLFSLGSSDTSFNGNTVVTFKGNKASNTGGAIISHDNCSITFDGNSTVTFDNNVATEGSAMFCTERSLVLFKGTSNVNFNNNQAMDGGAINIRQSSIKFTIHSSAIFNYNLASKSGGAVYLENNFVLTFTNGSHITFHQNNATLHGGAIYGKLNQTNQSKLLSYNGGINFIRNTALIGDDVYVDVASSCDETCLNSSIVGVTVVHNNPPHHLALHAPATCVDATKPIGDCDTYFVPNIMLGQDIKIDACVLSLYNQSAGGVDFVVSGGSQHHHLDGTRFVPITCKLFEGISVLGKEISDKINFSMIITSYTNNEAEISVGLIAELSPCHPGFIYDNTTQSCVCYNDNDIISCSGSTSSIKGGYWFGIVDGKSTVTVCPNNYCNFTCCEKTNGFYQLSPVRTNQCSSHRSGTTCGSCEEDYTLSFDSSECISVNKCTTGQTILVVTLSMIYWMAVVVVVMVVVVFIVTYYHVGIGYLYAITYYYSMLDILLDHNLYASQGLFTAISIMSSIAKITPQFLGQLCFVQEMSGIDQQFIHYVHPLAVTTVIAIICLLARMSYRFSSFVSRGIIHVICFLLLLSYTSVATTSLLLLRSLTFDNVNKVYTYLSPDIEYCHGRHLPYFIVAVLCTIVIVIGLPLLLLLEPFLNRRINFTRLKPLLDQFQGCYKDKYRSFAAFYMICRLLIILIIVITSSNSYTTQILLLTTSTLLLLMYLMVKPYKNKTLNIFDGIVLYIMIFASVISFFSNFGSGVVSAITIVLVTLPLVAFVVMQLVVYKELVKRIASCCRPKPDTTKDSNGVPPMYDNGISIIIDDSMRKNATICEM